MKKKTKFQGREFITSSFSGVSHSCVGVSISPNDVAVINTNKEDTIVTFTHDEWAAFVKGVKNNEFDLK